ncbi:MAG: MlaD family protein [Chthoniobacterales bacterium]|nr:MlaD family protein [Chthoniobacterales bacterium]
MKSKLNPITIGSFLLCTVALLVISLIFFQSSFLFNQPIRFVSYFNEPVQGLDIGSKVKLRGVAIGNVVSISVQYDWKTAQSNVLVIGDLNKNAMMDTSGKPISLTDPSTLRQLVQQGLRAKIGLVGITGLQFVELDFFDPGKYSKNTISNTTPYPMIPTLSSGMSELADDLAALMKNARKIDFAKISTDFTTTTEELTTLISTLNKETKDIPLKKMILQISAAASSIKRLADYLDQNPSALIFGRKPTAATEKHR